MPIIRIDYDNEKIDSVNINKVSHAIRDIVAEVTQIEDVFVYGNSSEIKIKIAPIEIFVELSAHKIENIDELTTEIVARLSEWKKDNHFTTLINFTLIPMPWKIEIGI
jgi:hypothetical protein